MYTLIATAKLNSVDPQAWLADVLRRIADHPALPTARAVALELEATRNPRRCRLTISHYGLGRMLTSYLQVMILDLTDEETDALARLLSRTMTATRWLETLMRVFAARRLAYRAGL